MEQVTDRIWTETKVRGCNPSFVQTSVGPGRHRHAAAADEGRRDARATSRRWARSST